MKQFQIEVIVLIAKPDNTWVTKSVLYDTDVDEGDVYWCDKAEEEVQNWCAVRNIEFIGTLIYAYEIKGRD